MITEDQIWFQLNADLAKDNRPLPELIDAIEMFFEKLVGSRPILFPSARSAISAVLKLKGMNRSHVIYAPKWSSHCVWETVGRRSNPTVDWREKLDAAIVVHRWGHVTRVPETSKPKVLIEDSVDTLLTSKKGLFPNLGDFEVQSLQKLVGSYSGGLLYCRKAADKAALIDLRNQSPAALATSQDNLKWGVVNKKKFAEEWHPWEWKNFGVTNRAALNILQMMTRYQENVEICQRRGEILKKHFPLSGQEGRVPTVWPANVNKGLPALHFDKALSTANPNYVKVGCLPIHAEILEADFTEATKSFPRSRI